LEIPTSGKIFFEGNDVTHQIESGMKEMRRRIQMVFQDPYESLNPTQTISYIVGEPLDVHGLAHGKGEREEKVIQALEDAGLKPAELYLHRFPHQLSGGQRQRVVIAGALVLEPHLLLADEPVSMLDVSIRAEIINLLYELRESRQISVIFITHDLGTVGYFADRIAVMYLGRIVEIGATHEVLENPQHPYTKALLSVIPVPNPRLRRQRIILQGETPNPINLPEGCRFNPRCPLAKDVCKVTDPPFISVNESHQAACLFVGQ
jgi:peptide/nickel transport system ATP-binding protein